jgi:uncharacterized membrane protein
MDPISSMRLVTVATLSAGGLSAWIAASNRGGKGLPGCGAHSGCAAIAASRWARWGPVPISIVGAVLYLAWGALTGVIFLGRVQDRPGPLPEIALVLAFSAAGAGVWFLLLQLLVIRQGCLYCNLVHGLGWIGLVLLLAGEPESGLIRPQRPACMAGCALAVLVAGQVLWRPRSYAIREVAPEDPTIADGNANPPVPTARPSVSTEPADCGPVPPRPNVSRPISFLGGRIRLDTSDWPIVGSVEAEHLLALLFDYTCPTCRRMHQLVNEAVTAQRGALAVLLLPVPLHPACNPTVKKLFPGRGYACQYARLSIGVWQARPDRFEAFDRYMFAEAEPPPLGIAIARAEELTGVRVNPHQPDPRQDCVVHRAIKAYQAAELQRTPSLLLPRAKMDGEVRSLPELQAILKHQLRL